MFVEEGILQEFFDLKAKMQEDTCPWYNIEDQDFKCLYLKNENIWFNSFLPCR